MNYSIQFLRDYASKKHQGERTSVYVVTGKDMSAYEEAQGSYLVIDEETGKHLWFSNRFVGNLGELIVTKENKIFPNMDWLQKIKASAKLLFGKDGDMQMLYISKESEKHMSAGQPYKLSKTTETVEEDATESEDLGTL
jgi:hypothetical protein